jgi:hypothetical protein
VDVPAIRAKLAKRLDELVKTDGQTSPYWLSSPTVPSLMISGTPDVEYAREGWPNDDSEIQLLVLAFVGIVDDVAAQDRLDRWKASSGGESVRAILERADVGGDGYLDGLAYGVTVLRASENTLYDLPSFPSASVLGCEFTVRVLTSG